MSSTIVIILVVIAVLILSLTAFLIIRRQRYVRALRGRGWTFESRPSLEWVLDHHAPPFGLGFVRKVDEAISGQTRGGVPFRVFEYTSPDGGARFDDRVASLQLPLPLPDLFISTAFRYAPLTPDMPEPRCPHRCLMQSPPSAAQGTKSISASTGSNWWLSVHPRTRRSCRPTWNNSERSPRRSTPPGSSPTG